MTTARSPRVLRIIPLLITICLLSFPVYAKYSGGTGEPNDPYQIATAEDLMLLGDTPDDYYKNKHFILTADIDLDPNLPGRKVFDRAVIAPDTDPNDRDSGFQGRWFYGVFDGNGHTISHLTIKGAGYVGLFGYFGGEVRDLGLVDVNISGSECVGGLVSHNSGGTVTGCYITGAVSGSSSSVGGLIGWNFSYGHVTYCYSTGTVSGKSYIGGLVGSNGEGTVTYCYSAGAVRGESLAGGLVGESYGSVLHSVWDMEMSGMLRSDGGVGLTNTQMMDPNMLGLNGFANDPNWVLDAGRDYPRLAWERKPGGIIPEPNIDWLQGQGTPDSPYRIDTADQLMLLSKASILWDEHLVLTADIDLNPNLPNRMMFRQSPIQLFTGVFDGNDHVISNLVIEGGSYLGLFGKLESGAEVRDLGTVNVNVTGSGSSISGLVGDNHLATVTQCYSTGAISGTFDVGGLVGLNNGGDVTGCYSAAGVRGSGTSVGGLVGNNNGWVKQCYSTGAVSGYGHVGGLVGWNSRDITQCYSAGAVSGNGGNEWEKTIGGLVGWGWSENVFNCFWDTQTSGRTWSYGGTGKTTAQMQEIRTYQDVGWDFAGEIKDGLHEIWQMPEQGGYPVLAILEGYIPTRLQGLGTPEDPYLISDALELGAVVNYSPSAHYRLVASIDLSGIRWGMAVVPYFGGTFDGNGHTISNLTIEGVEYVGLFGQLASGAEVKDLGVVDVNIVGSGGYIGGLVGSNMGSVTRCFSSGAVSGTNYVGGLVGSNEGPFSFFGGGALPGGTVSQCYSTGAVCGNWYVGGLVGNNGGRSAEAWSSPGGSVTNCYSSGLVSGTWDVGGLVGRNRDYWGHAGIVTGCFWDIQASGQDTSAGGTGKTTVEMQTARTFLDAGWDFVGETANGTDDIWWILEGKDYPRLWWER